MKVSRFEIKIPNQDKYIHDNLTSQLDAEEYCNTE